MTRWRYALVAGISAGSPQSRPPEDGRPPLPGPGRAAGTAGGADGMAGAGAPAADGAGAAAGASTDAALPAQAGRSRGTRTTGTAVGLVVTRVFFTTAAPGAGCSR